MTTAARIIVLDDDQANADILAENLRARGFDALVPPGREAAVDLAQAGRRAEPGH